MKKAFSLLMVLMILMGCVAVFPVIGSASSDALSAQASRLQHTYIKQSLTWKDRYYNGDDASKAAYVAENQAFFDMLTAHNVLMLEGNPIGNYHVDVTQAPTAWTK